MAESGTIYLRVSHIESGSEERFILVKTATVEELVTYESFEDVVSTLKSDGYWILTFGNNRPIAGAMVPEGIALHFVTSHLSRALGKNVLFYRCIVVS